MTATLKTPLHSIIAGLATPIVLGPMANAAGGALAGKVSRAGGLGFIGAGYYTADKLQSELGIAKELIPKDDGQGRLSIGVGFLAWRLTLINKGVEPPTLGAADMDVDSAAIALIDAALRVKPRAIWLSFGTADELIGWSAVVRQREAALNGQGKATYGTALKLFIGVGNEYEAKTAVEDCGADVVCIQGNEAGGHGNGASPPLSAVLPLLSQRVKQWSPSNPSSQAPALLAAGGIMTGDNVAGALAQGADGVVVGTRMLMTPDAAYSDAQKDMLLRAGPGSTKRTMAFDEARGTLGWPQGVDGRGIVNETVHDFEQQKNGNDEQAVKARQATYKQAESNGDTARIVTWAGTGVGLVNEIKPTEEVIAELTRDAVQAIKRLTSFIA